MLLFISTSHTCLCHNNHCTPALWSLMKFCYLVVLMSFHQGFLWCEGFRINGLGNMLSSASVNYWTGLLQHLNFFPDSPRGLTCEAAVCSDPISSQSAAVDPFQGSAFEDIFHVNSGCRPPPWLVAVLLRHSYFFLERHSLSIRRSLLYQWLLPLPFPRLVSAPSLQMSLSFSHYVFCHVAVKNIELRSCCSMWTIIQNSKSSVMHTNQFTLLSASWCARDAKCVHCWSVSCELPFKII